MILNVFNFIFFELAKSYIRYKTWLTRLGTERKSSREFAVCSFLCKLC